MLPDYSFYMDTFHGISIPSEDWARLSTHADRKIRYFERAFAITGNEESRNLALCAVADMMYTYEMAAASLLAVDESGNIGASNVSIGSVSTSSKETDVSGLGLDMTDKGQNTAYFSILKEFMDVYRGA